jgi:mono/diheme cytochrome c family protein
MREPQIAPPRLHVTFAALGLGFLAIYSWVFFREQGEEWRAAQASFRKLEATVKNPHQLAEGPSVSGLRQVWLPDLGRVDRCTTCHLGIDDPVFVGAVAPQPFRSHPGTWLATHPDERFGCTVCHGGQGEATNTADAAHDPGSHFERPMRPLETIEANCGTCHRALDVADAPRLSEGRRLILDSGCVACHEIPGFERNTFRGPDLLNVGYKVRPEWLAAWLKDPKAVSATSRMGNFRLSEAEIAALGAFLLSQKAEAPSGDVNLDWKEADTDNGRALFGELRCVSCHAVNGRGGSMGPELTLIGDKVRRDWLFSFLQNPHRDQPETAMLQYRLGDDQVRDLTAFLLEEYNTPGLSSESAAAPYQDPSAVAEGRAVFLRRGCYGCHRLSGVSETAKLGPSLKGVADRNPDELPYGNNVVRHTTDNYLFLKLLMPDALGSASLMPTFGFTPAEAATITVALESLREGDLPSSRVVQEAVPPPYRPQGRFGEIVRRYRCLSCHRIGGSGGDLSTVPLDRIGSQLQSDYLVAYLLNPGAVRVSVEARMPVFHMLPQEAKAIADYAAAVFLDDELDAYDTRFTPADAARGEALYRQLGCVGCHQLNLSGGYVGPDLSNTGTRLRPGWIAAFLAKPQRYKPGTLQPDYGLSPEDTRALTAYLSTLGAAGRVPR